MRTIKSLYAKSMEIIVEPNHPCWRYVYPGFLCKLVHHILPGSNVAVIVTSWELGDPKRSVGFCEVGFGPGSA